MTKIDWFFKHESEHFIGRLEKLVIEIHRLATEQLRAVCAAESEDAAKDLGEDYFPGYEKFLEAEHRDQQRALSTMALTMLERCPVTDFRRTNRSSFRCFLTNHTF